MFHFPNIKVQQFCSFHNAKVPVVDTAPLLLARWKRVKAWIPRSLILQSSSTTSKHWWIYESSLSKVCFSYKVRCQSDNQQIVSVNIFPLDSLSSGFPKFPMIPHWENKKVTSLATPGLHGSVATISFLLSHSCSMSKHSSSPSAPCWSWPNPVLESTSGSVIQNTMDNLYQPDISHEIVMNLFSTRNQPGHLVISNATSCARYPFFHHFSVFFPTNATGPNRYLHILQEASYSSIKVLEPSNWSSSLNKSHKPYTAIYHIYVYIYI